MTAPAKSPYPRYGDDERPGVPDEALSPEDLEELEAFRRMQKIGLEVTAKQMAQLLRRTE